MMSAKGGVEDVRLEIVKFLPRVLLVRKRVKL